MKLPTTWSGYRNVAKLLAKRMKMTTLVVDLIGDTDYEGPEVCELFNGWRSYEFELVEAKNEGETLMPRDLLEPLRYSMHDALLITHEDLVASYGVGKRYRDRDESAFEKDFDAAFSALFE